MFEETEPKCSLTVVGELLLEEPIRDCNARRKDILALIGEPIWGSQKERIPKARKLFETWFEILNSGIRINAAKDVTKGGLVSTLYEISKKSGVEFELKKTLPFTMTRNLDNFLISVSGENYEKIVRICMKNKCRILRVGTVM